MDHKKTLGSFVNVLTGLLSGLVLLGATAAPTPVEAAPTRRFRTDDRGNFVLIGNTVGQDCRPGVPNPVVGADGGLLCGLLSLGDSGIDAYWRSESPTNNQAQAGILINSNAARSTALLNLPAGAAVTYARLYWATQRAGSSGGEAALFERPGGMGRVLTAPAQDIKTINFGGLNYYQASADVTPIVRQLGSGTYRVSGFNSFELGNLLNDVTFSAWNLVVFYKLDTDPVRNLVLFDGLDLLSRSKVTATLTGIQVPAAGAPEARMGIVAYEGDSDIKGETLRVNNTVVSDALNPADNLFNSTRSRLGTPVSVKGDLPQLTGGAGSMSGVDMDILDISSLVKNNDTQISFEAETGDDEVFLGAVVTAIGSNRPVFSGSTKTFVNMTRTDGRVLPGDVIEYTLTVRNNGTDNATNVTITDVLPAQVTFVPTSLRISAGPNMGNKTDAAGDDQAEYVTNTRTVVARLGTGASATLGGTILTTDAASTLVFRVTVNTGATGLVSNQAVVGAQGQANNETTTWPTGNGTDPATPTVFQISTCSTSADCPVNAPVCDTTLTPPQCVCRMDNDCPSGTVCNPTSKTCTQCTSTNTTNCSSGTTGAACLPNGTCGCNNNADCGGRNCDPVTKTCPPVSTDLSVTISRQPAGAGLAPGSMVTYTVSAKNNGTLPIVGATLNDSFQPTTDLGGASWTCSASGGAVCPAASGNGALPTVLNLPAGAQITYTVNNTLPTAQMSTTVDYTVAVTPPRGFVDSNPADNVASDSILIVPGGPDLVVTVTETKSPTDPAVTYTINVHNNGPGAADGATVTYDIPPGATLQDVMAGQGWMCTSSDQRVTCTRTEPIPGGGDATPISIKVLPPTGADTIPVKVVVAGTDSQGNPVSDPDPSNNTIDRTTEVQKFRLSGGGLAYGCSVGSEAARSSGATVALFGVLLGALALSRRMSRPRRSSQSARA